MGKETKYLLVGNCRHGREEYSKMGLVGLYDTSDDADAASKMFIRNGGAVTKKIEVNVDYNADVYDVYNEFYLRKQPC